MSKKIIYLLSLLMALSLVFASCKKSPVGVQGGNPNQEDNTIKENTGGLQNSWDEIKNKTIMNNYPVIGESGGDYFRNPVVVALGSGNILIVTEKRINYPGSDNDIGVNGENPVDIVYLLSSDAGDNFSTPAVVGETSVGDAKTKAVSAPVVYYKKGSGNSGKVYIIASAGSGISRTDQNYSERDPKSKLRYIVGEVSGIDSTASIKWDTWKDLTVGTDKISADVQYGTHTARGLMSSDGNTFVLPIITAKQGKNGAATEMMGVRFFKVNASTDTLTFGEKIGQEIEFAAGTKDNFSKYKSTKAVAVDGNLSKVDYLTVSSPSSSSDGLMGKGDSSSGAQPTAVQGLKGSEGAFGFLKFAQTWYGANPYDPATYAKTPGNAGGADGKGGAGQNATLFSHVQSQVGANYLYMLDDNTYIPKGNSYQLAKTSKTSSIDVLPDGTVIIVAEKERNTSAAGNKFNIFFSRYTQQYLASQLQ